MKKIEVEMVIRRSVKPVVKEFTLIREDLEGGFIALAEDVLGKVWRVDYVARRRLYSGKICDRIADLEDSATATLL